MTAGLCEAAGTAVLASENVPVEELFKEAAVQLNSPLGEGGGGTVTLVLTWWVLLTPPPRRPRPQAGPLRTVGAPSSMDKLGDRVTQKADARQLPSGTQA